MIYDFQSIPEFLSAELRRRSQSNHRYSLRSFARQLHLSPGALSEILKGRRELSLRSIDSVAKAIGLNAAEARHLLQLAQNAKVTKAGGSLKPKAPLADQRMLCDQIFALVSEWYHFAILNLLECEGFQWKATWIAARLGISRVQAKLAMDLLVKLKLVLIRDGRSVSASGHVLSSSDIPSEAVRNYHRQILQKALSALDVQSVTERDFSGVGLALDIKRLPALKKEISEFQDHIAAKYSSGKRTEIYFLESALFKLTQRETR